MLYFISLNKYVPNYYQMKTNDFQYRCSGWLLGGLLLVAGCLTSCSRGITAQGQQPLNAKQQGWQQREFILSTFHAVGGDTTIYEKILTQTKESGINLVELSFLSPDKLWAAMRAAEAVGVKVLAEDLSTISGVGDKFPAFTEETVKNTVAQLKGFKMLEGYYIWDEPHEKDFPTTRRVHDLVKKYDSNRLAFSVIFPSYGVYTWEKGSYEWANNSYPRYVDNYLKTVDPEVFSFDYYPFHQNKAATDLINNDIWKDFGYIRKKALEYNKPLWFYFQAVSLQQGQQSIMDINRIRAQVYAALAYGVKGLSYFNSAGSLLDEQGNKTAMYDDLKSLNTDIRHLGDFLLNKRSEKLYQTGVKQENRALYFLDSMAISDLFVSAPDNLVIGVFGDGSSTKYVLVSNKSHLTEVTGELKLRKPGKIYELDRTGNTTNPVAGRATSIPLNLPPGMGALYIIKK
jgi:hypothetical protein